MTWNASHSDFQTVRGYARGEFFTRTYIARKLGISVSGFRRAQERKTFPLESFRDGRKEPLFTMEEMQAIIIGYRLWKKDRLKRNELRAYIDKHSK